PSLLHFAPRSARPGLLVLAVRILIVLVVLVLRALDQRINVFEDLLLQRARALAQLAVGDPLLGRARVAGDPLQDFVLVLLLPGREFQIVFGVETLFLVELRFPQTVRLLLRLLGRIGLLGRVGLLDLLLRLGRGL